MHFKKQDYSVLEFQSLIILYYDFKLDYVSRMISAESSCAAVLITMGVLLGRLTPVQFLLLAFFETGINVLVEHYVFNYLHVR